MAEMKKAAFPLSLLSISFSGTQIRKRLIPDPEGMRICKI